MVSADKVRRLWDFLSELRSSLCERRLERTVLRPALLPVKIAQFTQLFRQVRRHTVKSLSLTESVWALAGWNSYTLIDNDSEIFQPGFKYHVKDGIESG